MVINPLQTILLVVIILLAGYIIYLQLLLVRKNNLVESIVSKLANLEKSLDVEEIKRFLNEIRSLTVRPALHEDKLFDDSIINFILGQDRDSKIFIHYTRDENDAKNILKEGFRYVESFYKTALPITNDRLDLMIKHNNKKYYGNFIIVIGISNGLIHHYSAELENAGLNEYTFENVLTTTPPLKDENADIEYLLPPQYVKGYLNYRTGEIFSNPLFDPRFISPGFEENINMLKFKKTKFRF
jgi:hypothetical protein